MQCVQLRFSRKTPSSSTAASSLSLFAITLDQKSPHAFFFLSCPFQLHLSSLTEKVWNRLKVRPQNKEPWHVLKPVWDTHTQWAQKGKLCSKKPLISLLDIFNFFQFNCTALTFDRVSVRARQAAFAFTVGPLYLLEYKIGVKSKIHLTHNLCPLRHFRHPFLIPVNL